MIDNLRQLAIFAKAIDHGSFRKAAAELRLSPSVVSHQISQLEEDLGVALMYRTTRKLRLTTQGEAMLAAAHKMLEAVEHEFLNVSATAKEPSGELRITAPSVLTLSPLMEAFAAFSKTYPRIKLSLDFTDARRDIIDDGFDVAIRMGKRSKKSGNQRRLFFVKRILVGAAAFVAQQRSHTAPDALQDWDWIALTPVQNLPLEFHKDGAKSVRIAPKANVATNDAQALYRLARAGAGLAIVPDFLANADVASGDIEHVLPDWAPDAVEVFAKWPANAPRNGLIKLFLDEIGRVKY